MEPNPTPERPGPNPAADVHAPRAAVPVMDIVPPKAPEPNLVAVEPPQVAESPADTPEPAQPAPAASSADDGVAQPPTESSDDLLPSEVPVDTPSEDMAAQVEQAAKAPKSGNNTVAFAIAATVVIVLGLAIIAVIAYTSSK